jgi:hypothetical protein
MKTNVLVLTLLALIVISAVGVYHMPFGLRGMFSEGFQGTAATPTVANSNMPMPEGEPTMQPMQPQASVVPPATPKAITTTKVNNKKPVNTPSPPPPPPPSTVSTPSVAPAPENQAMINSTPTVQAFQNASPAMNQSMQLKNAVKEGFRTNYAEVSGGAKDQYQPIGAFDGVALPTGNNVSAWRYTSPDEPLLGAPFELGNDSLFMFKNNQCKPSCCGSSLSCSGGCVCTTPDQRQFIAGRGGNRTKPAED